MRFYHDYFILIKYKIIEIILFLNYSEYLMYQVLLRKYGPIFSENSLSTSPF